ncbi:class I SAM-dependent methyltransferase [Desulfosporosinus sp. PR]|uniref:class I SAM-dependent methyltransferase n=1 Tax=Candidatus Desulfosporosinus nitrosoreducens TaxID=3401928 RepID=UPI0027F298D9|nr:class I SAM-dependent methyltransferase [Desulfosporosinus sp. PR]MDQ7094863.1 class I SAM-dependent methyltransferase [Desulfosporosinus sp. PR]
MKTIEDYWDKKFKEKGHIWGNEPSKSALITESFLSARGFKKGKILDIACGYGRDSKYFTDNGFDTTGIDISAEGIAMAKKQYPDVKFMIGDILHLPFQTSSFDYVFGNFILHLLLKDLRFKLIKETSRLIKPGGILVFSVASIEDVDFGKGETKDTNCFVNARGVMKYYYSKEAIYNEFKDFEIMAIHDIEEIHDHDGIHKHKSYLLFVRKRNGRND